MAKFVTVYTILVLLFVLQSFFAECMVKRLRRVRRGWLSSGKPAGVKCAFNPCSVSGFCGTGRTCEMDDNCRHHCECDQGSTHELCVEAALEQKVTPKPMKCTFNPCASPAFACDGDRKCVLGEFCMPECACLDGSTHQSCQDQAETTTKHTTQETTEANKCKTGEIPCTHGSCAREGDQYTCECDKGWGGDSCNESRCTMQCTEGFYCHFVTPSVQICVESVLEQATDSTVLPTPTTKPSFIANVCNVSYISHDNKEQKCPSGTACKYGVCISDGDEEQCMCDAGASGTLCEYKCCRECGEFGTCVFDEEIGETCSCNVNYTGNNCTELRSEFTNDVCSFITDLCDGKTCVPKAKCMEWDCICDETSTSPECANATTTKETVIHDTVTSSPMSCPCVNGDCKWDRLFGTFCDCHNGWTGTRCDFECKCPLGYKCVAMGSAAVCFPPVGDTWNTLTEETSEQEGLFVGSNDSVAPNTPSLEDQTIGVSYNVCDSNYTQRPTSETDCYNWQCIYGICKTKGTQVICECDPGATGQICQHKCCRQCVFGECFYFKEEEREICVCQTNYTGPYCERWDPPTTQAPPEEVTWHYWVVGACAVLLLILITLMVVVPYIMWRNRVILVMKVVHYFQGYEDEDDRQWDAFISYKSNKADERFVVKTLFPKLEKEMGFKVNVHFRDFVPGETIANNIISAVQGSRRTIMIITPSYVTSEFTKFEYQVAQQEMLKRKHRIIPILFEDVAECKETMDPNLKVILDSVTYIEWPKDGNEKKLAKFWKRMELSMPKIKNRSIDTDSTKTQTNGTVTMTKPEDINLSLSNENRKSKTDVQNGNIYTMIDENKLERDEVYDTLNESEMQSKVVMKKTDSNQNGHTNVLKVDV